MVLEVIINRNGDVLNFVNLQVDDTEIKYESNGSVRRISGDNDRIKLAIHSIN